MIFLPFDHFFKLGISERKPFFCLQKSKHCRLLGLPLSLQQPTIIMLSPLPPSSGSTLRPTTVNEKTGDVDVCSFSEWWENPNNLVCVKLATGHKSGLQGKHLLEVHGKRKPFEFQTHVAFQASWIMSGRLIVTIEAFFQETRGIYAEQVPYNKWSFYDFLWFSHTNPIGCRLRITFWCGPRVSKSPIHHILAPKKNCWELRMSTP